MEEKFIEFVAEVMDVSKTEISMDTQYADFEAWDSMMMLTLIMEIEDEYDVSIPMSDVGKIKYLRDMYNYIGSEK